MRDKTEFDLLLASGGTAGAIGFLVGIARGIIQARHGSLGAWVRGITASLFVGVAVGWGLSDTTLSTTTQAAIIACCAYVADDVLLGMLVLGGMFSRDPAGFASRVLDGVRGRASKAGGDQ
ncbi:MAG TPA: hypothetical protein VNV16_11905 [Methylibium sp.]|nr:hypothetical protein [Methylibium sp.]